MLARRPEIALVDELAHTNIPGSAHPKRWQDVDALLDAGIDVITTVNVQHIESLERGRREDHRASRSRRRSRMPWCARPTRSRSSTSPRSRCATGSPPGVVYPAERIDAALSNYFRLGNLTALRELALLWLADEVDSALRSYRADHGIEGSWQARERVVVALTGGPEGETLLRRGARIAARSAGGELLAVHVADAGRPPRRDPGALAAQRALVESLGGSFHQIVGDDIPGTLVEFAQGADATQLVIGVSRRSRLMAALTGPGIGSEVIRRSGDIDVHIVTHAAAGGRVALPRITGGALGWRRQVLGFAVAARVRAAAVVAAVHVPQPRVDHLRGARLPAARRRRRADRRHLRPRCSPPCCRASRSTSSSSRRSSRSRSRIRCTCSPSSLYVVIAILVSLIVDQAARRARTAKRAAAEAELLAAVAGNVLRGDNAVLALVSRTREAFGLSGVRLLVPGRRGARRATASPLRRRRAPTSIPVGSASTRRPAHCSNCTATRSTAPHVDCSTRSSRSSPPRSSTPTCARPPGRSRPSPRPTRCAAPCSRRSSHDLRRPLASAVAAIGGLRGAHELSADDRAELLATADESLATLSTLVTDLLDVSRVQAGVLAVSAHAARRRPAPILAAVDELGLGAGRRRPRRSTPTCRRCTADPVLLQRVLVNVLANAHRHSPDGTDG